MITNVKIELDDESRSRLADLIDGKHTKRLASRRDIVILVLECIESAVRLGPADLVPGESIGNVILSDIDRGAWSFVDQPAAE